MPRDALPHAAAFIRKEEKGAVFLDRASECSAELILILLRRDWVEVSFCVQNGVAEIFVNIAVELVGARLCDDVDDGAGVATVFGIEGIGDDAKLLDGVGRGLDGRRLTN